MFAHALALGASRNTSGAAAAGSALTVPPTAPTHQWHAAFGVTATGSPSRVSAVVDQKGVANLSPGTDLASLGGPLIETDSLTRPFWHFTGQDYLNIASGFAVATQQACSYVIVQRLPRAMSGFPIIGLGSVNQGSAVTTGSAVVGVGGTESFVKGASVAASTDATNKHKCIAGAQLHAVGVFSRASGQRLYINNDTPCTVAVNGVTATNTTGGEIGRYPFSPGAIADANFQNGAWYQGAIYEIMIFVGTISDAQADAIMAAVVSNWNIPTIAHTVLLDGDSITMSAQCKPMRGIAAYLCDPGGSDSLPSNVRVINKGTNGDKVPNLVTKRDATNSIYGLTKSSGKNIVLFEIGRNDMAGGTPDSAATCYSNIVAYLHTTSTGVLERGWEVIAGVNIATSNGAIQGRIDSLRVLMRDIAQFRTDTTGTSATLNLADFPLITVSAATVFNTTGDAGSGTYYTGGTHLSELGNSIKVHGGDVPSSGMAAIINTRLAA